MNSSATCPVQDTVRASTPIFSRGEFVWLAACVAGGSLWIGLFDYGITALVKGANSSVGAPALKWLNSMATIGLLLYVVWRRTLSRQQCTEQFSPQHSNRFELVARAATDAVFDWDLKTQSLWWGSGRNNLFGYPREHSETNPEGWSGRVHPEDREKVKAGVQRVAQGSGDAWGDEFRLICQEGTFAFVVARGLVIRDASGQPVRLLGGMHDITGRRECEQKLSRSRQQLRALSARVESLREEERKRIARELHDTLGQMLTGLKMDLRWIEKSLSPERADPSLNPTLDRVIEAGELTDHAIRTVQQIATELRPGVLDHLGLATAINREAQRIQERTGLRFQLQVADPMPEIPSGVAVGLFRMFQEALTNILRHADATEVAIRLWPDNDHLHLEIADNGKGISPAALANPKSLGLLGMNERAALLGGEIKIEAGENRGTVVTVRVPGKESSTGVWELP